MLGKLFQKDYHLVTSLTEEEVFNKLEKHSVGGSLDDSRIKIFFNGKFNLEQHEFRLLQVFDIGPNDRIRTEIIGFTKPGKVETAIDLNIRLPKKLETVLDFVLIFNIVFLIAIAFIELPEEIPRLFFFIGFPIGLLVFYLICQLTFNSKALDCITKIERIISAKKLLITSD